MMRSNPITASVFVITALFTSYSVLASDKTSVSARLASCDSAVVSAAANELLNDPKTLQEPLMLFQAASGQRMAGNTEEAAFLYLAASIRTSRQMLFEKGDIPQLAAVMRMTVGPLIVPALQSDPELARRVVNRVIAWDKSTADPFLDRVEVKDADMQKKLADIENGIQGLPGKISTDPYRLSEAREARIASDNQVASIRKRQCESGKLDSVDAESGSKEVKRQAEAFVRAHPLVIKRAGANIKSVSVAMFRMNENHLPSRMTVSVRPESGKSFFAEVESITTILPSKQIGAVETKLICLTDLWVGQRDSSWKDVCVGDQNAIKPD